METEPSDITDYCQCAAATTMADAWTTTGNPKVKTSSELVRDGERISTATSQLLPLFVKSGSEEVAGETEAADKKLNEMAPTLRKLHTR